MDFARFGDECRAALDALDNRCRALAATLDGLRAARAVDATALAADVTGAVALGEEVRTNLATAAARLGEPVSDWATADDLRALIARLDHSLGEQSRRDERQRLASLAGALRAGRFVNPKTGKTLTAYEPLRSAAADELDAGPGEGDPVFPGPPDPTEWLAWVWSDPATTETRLEPVQKWAPTLVQLLADTDPTHWNSGTSVVAPEPVAAVMAPPPEPEPEPSPEPVAAAAPKSKAVKRPPAKTAPPRQPAAPPRRAAPGSTAWTLFKALRPGSAPKQAPAAPKPKPLTEGVRAPASEAREAPAPNLPLEDAELPPEFTEAEVPDALVVDEVVPEPVAPPAAPFVAPARVQVVQPEPTPEPTPVREPEPEPPLKLGGAVEVAKLCEAGRYLQAAILCAGRVFAGEPEMDPRIDALVTAQHVALEGRTVPWPNWIGDEGAAEAVAGAAPESARLVFLAARCHAAADGAADPLYGPVADKLLGAFNDLSEVRNWLGLYLDVAAVPGLWDQLCRPAGPGPLEEYKKRRVVFATKYEEGLQYRNANVAYVHRQAHFICRKPGAKALFEHVPAGGPVPPSAAARDAVERFLKLQPQAIAGEWIATTERAGGGVRLHGNQRGDLVSAAANFLALANIAWKAAQVVLQNPVQEGDLDRRRKQLTDGARAALDRAGGRPWLPLLTRLMRGLTL